MMAPLFPRRSIVKGGVALGLAALGRRATAFPSVGGNRRQFVTRHRAAIGGAERSYTVEAADTMLVDETGRMTAAMFGFSYLLDVANPASRPVMFLFGGGPGGSSKSWHLQSMAPRAIVPDPERPGAYRLVENPRTILDAVDLVFVDPVSAGFSHAVPGVPERRFWGLYEDADAFAQFIRRWLQEHGRERAPVYIGGVSYGTVRAATLSNVLHRLGNPLAGVLLDSSVISYSSTRFRSGNDLPNIYFLPSYAAVHWYHGLRSSGVPLGDRLMDAQAFAFDRYAPALARGDRLPAAPREKIAGEMAALIGLPRGDLDAAGLRIESEAFMAAYGRKLGFTPDRSDGRVRGLGEAATIAEYRDAPPFLDTPIGRVARAYFRDDLGIRIDQPYVDLALVGGTNWNWTDGQRRQAFDNVDMAVTLAEDMRINPSLRVMMAAGHFDLATPYFASEMVLSSRGLPQERVVKAHYAAGHGVHRDAVARVQYQADLRRFVTGG